MVEPTQKIRYIFDHETRSHRAQPCLNKIGQKKQGHHVLLVDRVDASGNVLIRDSWEGTQYEMKFSEFDKIWNSSTIYRLDK